MQVIVSCAGRFHAFNLVEQLYKRNALKLFLTTVLDSSFFPNRALPQSLSNDPSFRSHTKTISFPEYLCYGIKNAPVIGNQSLSYLLKDTIYDKRATTFIESADIFTGWANQSLFQLREAKTRGAIAIIERGSSHISEQYRILREEYDAAGLKYFGKNSYDPYLEEKQLKEYAETDYIAVPSEFARKSFLTRGFPESKIIKIPYGVDLSSFFPAENPTLSPNGKLKILSVGAIGIQKGHHLLLQAVEKLKVSGIECELTLIGRMEQPFKEWLARERKEHFITTHLDFVANSLLVQHFHRNDVFCLASVQEGLALVIAEAMASGLPVVASTNTGAEEFIEQGKEGFVYDPHNIEALVEYLTTLANNPEQRRAMQIGAHIKANNFSWDTYGEKAYNAYQNLLAQKGSNSNDYQSFYNDYWDRSKAWTPTHSFSDEQLDVHFKGAFEPTDSVLDVGCGDASNYQAWLVKQVNKLSAIDISPSGIENAKRMGIDACIHDLSEPFPFPDNTFDGGVCIEVLEHLYDPKFCVKEIFRVLKPGGLLVASVPNNGYIRERLKAFTKAELSTSITDLSNEWKGAHIRFYNKKSFSRLFETAGFKVESIKSNRDSSIFDSLDAFGGYFTQLFSSILRKKLPRLLRLAFLEDMWPSLFAPHLIVRVRKPKS